MVMRQNSGEAFFHPVTHQLIEKGGFYQGAAHLEHEIIEKTDDKREEIIDQVENGGKDETTETSKIGKGKSGTNKSTEENK